MSGYPTVEELPPQREKTAMTTDERRPPRSDLRRRRVDAKAPEHITGASLSARIGSVFRDNRTWTEAVIKPYSNCLHIL